MVATLWNPKIYANKVKGVKEMSEAPHQCASYNIVVTFTDETYYWGLNLIMSFVCN